MPANQRFGALLCLALSYFEITPVK